MQKRRNRHRKNVVNHLKSWFPFLGQIFKGRKGRFEAPTSDIVFLTTAEVKASLANASAHEHKSVPDDSTPRPDKVILPQKNRVPSRSLSQRSFRHRMRKLFRWISFWNSKRKHVSSATHSKHNDSSGTRQDFDAKNASNNNEALAKQTLQSLQNPIIAPTHRRHGHHRRYHHRQKKINLKGLFDFFRKNKEDKTLLTPIPVQRGKHAKVNVPFRAYILPILTSTAIFMIAYQLCWFFYQLTVMLAASFYGIDSVLFYYEVMFPIGSNALKWTPEKIIIVTLAGPFFALISWTTIRFVLRRKAHYGAQLRTFLVWMYLISMMMFFGAFVGGAITLEGFGYVVDWLFMSITVRLLLSIVFLSAIIFISWKVVRFLPESSHSDSWRNNRYKFVLSRLIIPWFLGTCIMTIFKMTGNPTQHENIFDYDIINLATLLFAVVPALFNSRTRPHFVSKRKVNPGFKKAMPILWIASAILLVVLFRIVFSHGVYFNLIFDLNINFYN